jgi:hypothetical protein
VTTSQLFFKRDKCLCGETGLTAVLHAHARNLDFNPHVHIIIPAGSLNKRNGSWRQKLANTCLKVTIWLRYFGASLFKLFIRRHIAYTAKKWNADCEHAGQGNSALTYLARYLYRGVISEKNTALPARQGHVLL